MTTNQPPLDALYEISLSITPAGTLAETAERALSAYLDQLECVAGGIFEQTDTPGGGCYYEPVTALPAATDPMQTAAKQAEANADSDPPAEPSLVSVSGDRYHVFGLPGFGVLVLLPGTDGFDAETVEALHPLNEKLADSCRSKQAESKLREERNRFQAVFETIQEPVVNAVYRGGAPVITRVNPAFEETFGYDRSEVLGENINDLIVPPEQTAEATQIDEQASSGEKMNQEVRRQTADGVGDFLLRGAPVEATEQQEHFAMYVDITEEKERQRKLERLYDETEAILSASSREAVCSQTVAAATDILGPSLVGTYLYDRTADALTAAATTGSVDATFGGNPPTYTNTDTVVWEVYDSGEPVFIEDTESFEGTLPNDETPAGSAMILPLGSHGVFILSSTESEVFDEADYSFARLLSKLVETALNRAQRIQGLEGVQDVTRETLTADDHEAVAEVVLDRIPDVFELPISGMWEYDDGTHALEPIGSTGVARNLLGEMPTFEPGNSIAWRAFEQGTLKVVPDISVHPEVYNEDSVLASEVCVPIGEFGILLTGSTDVGSFTQSEQSLLETLGANLETTVRLISRRQELELLDQVLARILRHNIRNDLTVIMGLAARIEAESDGKSVENARQLIERCRGLQATAENASDVRHIVLNRDQRDELAVQAIVEQVVTDIRAEYPDAAVDAQLAVDPRVVVHPDFPVAVRHLVENGIEHNTSDQPSVAVSLFETDEGVVLEVTDDGPGIPDNEVAVLDQHGESALEHGSGAGLWIVDRVVTYSDGTLSFETSETGTTARIQF